MLDRFCEIAPVSPMHYPSSSVCQEHDCKNGGICFQPPGSSEYICKCAPGTKFNTQLFVYFAENSRTTSSENSNPNKLILYNFRL